MWAAMSQPQNAKASPVRTIVLVGVPLVWVVVALLHPQGDGDVYDSLNDKVGLWLGVHFAQPLLALGVRPSCGYSSPDGPAPRRPSLEWRSQCGCCLSRCSTR
jgi:hypothetical protein